MTNSDGQDAIIQFMDMHLERGRFAGQAEVRLPVVFGGTGGIRPEEMGLGDRLTLARDVDTGALRLETLNLKQWQWRVYEVNEGLVTGDGAMLLWRKNAQSGLSAITFLPLTLTCPISPRRLLVLGTGIDRFALPINQLIAGNCRRWIVEEVENGLRR